MKLAVASKRDLKLAWMLHRNIGRLEYSYLNSESKQQRIQKHILNILEAMGTGAIARIVMGYEVLKDNCTDPDLDHLDFNQKIKKAVALVDAQSAAPEVAKQDSETLKLGQTVAVSQRYFRREENEFVPQGRTRRKKVWKAEKRKLESCVFLGYRTLKNGWTDWDSDCGWCFRSIETIKVALVCPPGNKNPFYAPLEAISYGS
jgi:hypothetical protein